MTDTISLGVYRRLDNRLEGESDSSPRALELHNQRRIALHAIFDTDKGLRVVNWGDTDDINPHEFITLSFVGIAGAVFSYTVVPGLQWLGKKLAEKAVDTALTETVKAIVAKVRPKQEGKQLLDIIITLPDGTQINVDPPDRDATISVGFTDGSSVSIKYKEE
jgi:hypothetical protein